MTTISTKTLISRINRKLAPDGERLCVARGERVLQACGDYWIKDITLNALLHRDVDPVALGRELGVINETETVKT